MIIKNIIPIFTFSILSFLVWMIIIPYFIELLKHFKLWKQIREEATIWKATEFSKLHKTKTWTPTMWGLIILVIVFLMVLVSIFIQKLWLTENSMYAKQTVLSLFTLATVGFLWWVDDFLNVRGLGRTKWLSARFKMLGLIIFAWLWAFWFYYKLDWWAVDAWGNFIRTLNNPFWKDITLWMYFIPLFIFIIIACANSVNLTDGLDWLAWGLLTFSYWVYAFITFEQEFFMLSTLCVTIMWVLLAFLWYNVKPAKFYMWDIWSLALWANLWIMAMITNTIFVLIIIWAIYIFETLSVMIQLTSKKLRNWKKVFRIAPFHHHLEAIGWSEETVVFRLWIVWIILSIFWLVAYGLQI